MVAIYIWVNDSRRKLLLDFSGYGPRVACLNLGVSELMKMINCNSGYCFDRIISENDNEPRDGNTAIASRHAYTSLLLSLSSVSYLFSRG